MEKQWACHLIIQRIIFSYLFDIKEIIGMKAERQKRYFRKK